MNTKMLRKPCFVNAEFLNKVSIRERIVKPSREYTENVCSLYSMDQGL
jgi:hypothetical protein